MRRRSAAALIVVMIVAVAACQDAGEGARRAPPEARGGIALSGYGTTSGGRAFVFSLVINGDRSQAAAGPLDTLVAAVAAHPG